MMNIVTSVEDRLTWNVIEVGALRRAVEAPDGVRRRELEVAVDVADGELAGQARPAGSLSNGGNSRKANTSIDDHEDQQQPDGNGVADAARLLRPCRPSRFLPSSRAAMGHARPCPFRGRFSRTASGTV